MDQWCGYTAPCASCLVSHVLPGFLGFEVSPLSPWLAAGVKAMSDVIVKKTAHVQNGQSPMMCTSILLHASSRVNHCGLTWHPLIWWISVRWLVDGCRGQPILSVRTNSLTTRLWPAAPVVVHVELIPDGTMSVCCWLHYSVCWAGDDEPCRRVMSIDQHADHCLLQLHSAFTCLRDVAIKALVKLIDNIDIALTNWSQYWLVLCHHWWLST